MIVRLNECMCVCLSAFLYMCVCGLVGEVGSGIGRIKKKQINDYSGI